MLASRNMVVVCCGLLLISAAVVARPDIPEDRYQWLEDVWGQRSISWVKAANQRTSDVLEKDRRFPTFQKEALTVLESRDRLPMPSFFAGNIYNFWQDAHSVRGILRRTSFPDYLEPVPHWQTVLDYDQLAKADAKSWVSEGLTCLPPENEHCLVALSEGGEDAITQREFNLKSGQFVPGGFTLPHSKQRVAWVDPDTLLVALDWGPGSLTTSGYPFILKRWKRGEPLAAAVEIFRGKPAETGLEVDALPNGQRSTLPLLRHQIDFSSAESYIYDDDHLRRLPIPLKSHVSAAEAGQLIVSLDEDWQPDSAKPRFLAGSVVSLDWAAFRQNPDYVQPRLLFAPTEREFPQSVSATQNRVLVSTLDNVQGRLYSFRRNPSGDWSKTRLDLPQNRTLSVVNADPASDRFAISVQGFLTPSSLWLGDESSPPRQVKTLPAQFNGSDLVVEQLYTSSTDGTRIPYFVVHRRSMPYNGSNPTILTAYGGFQISRTPAYSAPFGKLWLERGGVYVVANIRGGGEFGPAWHEAGLTIHRQRIYDDFASVARDLIRKKVTSPRRLGITGGSNGGLLVGVEMTQHPELWHAVDIEIPLLDMLRFEKIAAGSSWVAEYGSVTNPEQRAFLASISPYHQLKPEVQYPEPFIFTTTRDDRVGPVHARKFAARLQELGKPFFYYEILEGGHGTGADLKEVAHSTAVRFVYFAEKLMD